MINDPQEMMAAYFEGKLNAEQVAELEAYLREDREGAKTFVRQAMLDSHLTELLHEQNVEDVSADMSDDSQFGALLQALDAPEGAVQLVHLTGVNNRGRKVQRNKKPAPYSTHDLAVLGGYVLRKALTSRPAYLAYAAAVVLVAAIFFIPWGSSQTPTPAPFANTPSDATPAAPTNPVATITATHNATWAEGALAPGSRLTPNQRLTLTAGFAEITTRRGAIAILEAPATIELLDNDNALHLHAGKLVGICETQSSKGFLVRTPHMDITDLGTRFGVNVQGTRATLAEVFQGNIAIHAAQSKHQDGQPIELTRGESLALDAHGKVIPRQPLASDVFAGLRQHLSGVTLTGQVRWSDTAPGVIRPEHWPTSDDVMLSSELVGYRLPEAVVTDMSADKSLTWPVRNPAAPIPAGTVVRTYVLAFHPGQGDPVQATGSVRFEGEILGVTTAEKSWNDFVLTAQDASDQLYTFEPEGPRGLFPEVDLDSRDQRGVRDKIWISADARTLNVEVTGRDFAELMRVIVLEPIDE